MTAFEPGRTDVVTAVVICVDGVTRRPVRGGVDARLWDPVRGTARPNRLVRNLSGHLVLLNEPADQDLTFRLTPSGYRPRDVTFNPSRDGVSRVVALERGPDGPVDETATLVRGSVVRSGGPAPGPVPGLTVSATPLVDPPPHRFPATTDERGAFALVVALAPPVTDEARPTAATRLRLEKAGLPVREFTVDLVRGHTHVLARPVDLDRDEPLEFGTTTGRSPRR